VSATPSEVLPEPVRRFVADAWTFRRQVELEAALRFARLAERLAQLGSPEPVVALARRAADDEQRHARLCEALARDYGQTQLPEAPTDAPEVAPPGLPPRERVLYEVVAACCITETESTAVLTTLLAPGSDERVGAVLRELLRDEVAHSRLGWAHLAREHAEGTVGFLGRYVPAMLEGGLAPGLFEPGTPESEHPALPHHGVLTHSSKREVFIRALEDVVLPGLERFEVDTAPARRWLAHRRNGAR
jgi:HEAT repeat protein